MGDSIGLVVLGGLGIAALYLLSKAQGSGQPAGADGSGSASGGGGSGGAGSGSALDQYYGRAPESPAGGLGGVTGDGGSPGTPGIPGTPGTSGVAQASPAGPSGGVLGPVERFAADNPFIAGLAGTAAVFGGLSALQARAAARAGRTVTQETSLRGAARPAEAAPDLREASIRRGGFGRSPSERIPESARPIEFERASSTVARQAPRGAGVSRTGSMLSRVEPLGVVAEESRLARAASVGGRALGVIGAAGLSYTTYEVARAASAGDKQAAGQAVGFTPAQVARFQREGPTLRGLGEAILQSTVVAPAQALAGLPGMISGRLAPSAQAASAAPAVSFPKLAPDQFLAKHSVPQGPRMDTARAASRSPIPGASPVTPKGGKKPFELLRQGA